MESDRHLSSKLFPDLGFILSPLLSPPQDHGPSKQNTSSNVIHEILTSYATLGPFLPRLVANELLALPLFTVRLQRSPDSRNHSGMLTIGGFPQGLKTQDIVWTHVREYPTSQGGLAAPSESPKEVSLTFDSKIVNLTTFEVYPIAWEIPIEDVFLDRRKLPRSSLSSPNITLSALLDTASVLPFVTPSNLISSLKQGNSLIRGPADVVQAIYNRIGTAPFSCTDPHTLAFQISGRMFPVDPRDFVRRASQNETLCEPNLAPTDPPTLGSGYLYSWSLGTPFLKS